MSSTIVVTNLPSHTTEESLRKKFSEFGKLYEVEMNKDPDTGKHPFPSLHWFFLPLKMGCWKKEKEIINTNFLIHQRSLSW